MKNWHIYKGTNKQHEGLKNLPPPPKWRDFEGKIIEERKLRQDPRTEKRLGNISRGETFQASEKEIDLVNTALYLRRPLLVTGKPGTGKSSLAYSVAYELKLGGVLRWPITTRSTLNDGLYRYDAIGRLQEFQIAQAKKTKSKSDFIDIGKYIRLGPLGTALLPSNRPRVLLIDEIDKSDIDLPNDLLNIFEEGEFEIPELTRLSETYEQVKIFPYDGQDTVTITQGKVVCNAFPFIVLTSNAERDLPAPFLRRCIRLDIEEPSPEKLSKIVQAHFGKPNSKIDKSLNLLIETFLNRREAGDLATDQLLNAIYLTTQGIEVYSDKYDKSDLLEAILRHLSTFE